MAPRFDVVEQVQIYNEQTPIEVQGTREGGSWLGRVRKVMAMYVCVAQQYTFIIHCTSIGSFPSTRACLTFRNPNRFQGLSEKVLQIIDAVEAHPKTTLDREVFKQLCLQHL